MLFHRWFLNMVAHWCGRMDKRHANSTSPLLVRAQGTHKSTFCRDLIPPELRGYYTDSIDFSRKRDAEMYRYFQVAGDETQGEYLSPVEILDYLQKRTTIALSSGKAYHFGRLLQKEGIPSRHTNRGTVYRVVRL